MVDRKVISARLLWWLVIAPASWMSARLGGLSHDVGQAWLCEIFRFDDPATELPARVRRLRAVLRLAQQGSACRWLPRP